MNIDNTLLHSLGIGLVGDFGETWTHAALREVIEAHGGKNISKLQAGLTHVICDRKSWKDERVCASLTRYSPCFHVVSITWLLDSISNGELEPERRHSMQRLDEKSDERKNLKRAVVNEAFEEKGYDQQFQDGVDASVRELGSRNYHWYRDDTGFSFNINMTRKWDRQIQSFVLNLFEVNCGPPFYYACTATFKSHCMHAEGFVLDSNPETTVLARQGSPFHEAFYAWRMMFRCLTGADWEFRHWVLPNVERDANGNPQYAPGTGLRPLMPECAQRHQAHWADVQKRTPAHIRQAITTALRDIYKRTKAAPAPKPRSALKPSKPRPDDRGVWNARTGTFRKRVRIRLTPESSDDDERDPPSDDEDSALVGIGTLHFAYALPRAGEPAGEITMEWTGRAWFGTREAARLRCEEHERAERAAHAAKRPPSAQWTPDLRDPGRLLEPVQVRVGGGRVRYWDWEMFRKGFQGWS